MYDLEEKVCKTKPQWSNFENTIIEDDTGVFLNRLVSEGNHANRKMKLKIKIKCKYKLWK